MASFRSAAPLVLLALVAACGTPSATSDQGPAAATPPGTSPQAVPPAGLRLPAGGAHFVLTVSGSINPADTFQLEFRVPGARETGFTLCGAAGQANPCSSATQPIQRTFVGLPTSGQAPYRFGLVHGSGQPVWFAQGIVNLRAPVVVTAQYQYPS